MPSVDPVEILLSRAANIDATTLSVLAWVVLVILLAIFIAAWKRVGRRRLHLQKELAERKAMLADTSDKLLLEQRSVEELSYALEMANSTIAGKNIELDAMQKKISSLNEENEAIYTHYLDATEELKRNSIDLQYWRYFATIILRESIARLVKIGDILRDAIRSPTSVGLADTLEFLESTRELLELGNAQDVPKRIRDLRLKGRLAAIHLLPRLHRLAEEWTRTLGSRLVVKISPQEQPAIFSGSWIHLELVLISMLSNAIKHSSESSQIEFEFLCFNHRATFQISNWSPSPIAANIARATNEMMVGDPQRTRFDLYLIDQIANGYRAIAKLDNVSASEDGQSYLVRSSFTFSMR